MLTQLHSISNRLRQIVTLPLPVDSWASAAEVSIYQITKHLSQIHVTLKRIKRLQIEVASRKALLNYIEQCDQ